MGLWSGTFRYQFLQVFANFIINPLLAAIPANQGRYIFYLEELFVDDHFVGNGGLHERGAATRTVCRTHQDG